MTYSHIINPVVYNAGSIENPIRMKGEHYKMA